MAKGGCFQRSAGRDVSLAQIIAELNSFLVGWISYYRYAAFGFELQCLDEWIRRKLRCYTPQATQTGQVRRRVPAEDGRLGGIGEQGGQFGQGAVAFGQLPARSPSDAGPVVS